MKKFLCWLLSGAMVLMIAGCQGDNGSESAGDDTEGKLNIVTTIFPQYDFTRQITGDKAELTMLLSPGAESHSYDPSPQDIIKIQECDVFIYGGGDSDEWVERILGSMDTSSMKIISMMDIVEVVEEEIVEGMEESHDGHSHASSDFEDDEVEDRELSDWAGEWQSVYDYLLDGTLDEVMEHHAEDDDDMTKEDYYDYYETGYETDIEKMVITGNTMAFYTDGVAAEAEYQYAGYEILTYESGSKGVRYMFEAVGETNGAPKYVQFSDHEIGPTVAEHFHIYAGDSSQEALWEELENWPTYYPANLSGDDIADEMLGHDHDGDDDHGDGDDDHGDGDDDHGDGDDDHGDGDDDHGDEEVEYDEHVWTSPVNAIAIVEEIAAAVSEADSENADYYEENASAYISELEDLDAAFREVVQEGNRDTFIFGDRFPFRYFADEYGLDYYAAFPGCSTETEPSAKTVAFLIDKVRDEAIPVVFFIEFSNEKMADTICSETGAVKLQLHSCHNVTKDDFESGVTYLELMQQNVENLKEALA